MSQVINQCVEKQYSVALPDTALMGILNITPDSFSDGGKYLEVNEALHAGRQMITDGAQILDVGGMASGPGSVLLDQALELERILPIVKALNNETTISVDTFRSSVARPCLEEGARIINDISALRYDPEMPNLIKDFSASIVLMFSKESASHPQVTEKQVEYGDIIAHISSFFTERIEVAQRAGLSNQQIILDPGMGAFVSAYPEYSWEILDRLAELRSQFAEFRFLIGVSRKGFLGGTKNDRDQLSQLVAMFAVQDGVDIVRTHNVEMASACLRCIARS